MNISEEKQKAMYDLVATFLVAVNQKDRKILFSKFEVTSMMFDEILASLEYLGHRDLSLIAYEKTRNHHVINRPIFEIDEIEHGTFIVKCIIQNFRKDTELILQGYVDYEDQNLKYYAPLFKS